MEKLSWKFFTAAILIVIGCISCNDELDLKEQDQNANASKENVVTALPPACIGKPDPSIVCPAIYDPVCGCNGKTYGNACEAKRAGVLRYVKGTCESLCKGVPNPDLICLDIYKPVCGCDGKTYSNACYAQRAGILKYTEGSCSYGSTSSGQ